MICDFSVHVWKCMRSVKASSDKYELGGVVWKQSGTDVQGRSARSVLDLPVFTADLPALFWKKWGYIEAQAPDSGKAAHTSCTSSFSDPSWACITSWGLPEDGGYSSGAWWCPVRFPALDTNNFNAGTSADFHHTGLARPNNRACRREDATYDPL